ncbi:MAG: hypothetical protein JNJ96_05385 [Anaerolineales bacterium]|nr:hypothetical protein [Anaerolineales bacterium]
MNIKFADKVFRVLFVFAFMLGTVWVPGKNVEAQAPDAYFVVGLIDNRLVGEGWVPDSSVELTIDNPDTGPGADFSTLLNVQYTGGIWYSLAGNFDLHPGFIVRLDDGSGLIKELVIPNLAVTNIDLENDIIYGTSNPGTVVDITVAGFVFRHEIVNVDGNWISNFAVPGDEPDEQDITGLQTSRIEINQNDADGDFVNLGFYPPSSRINVHVDDNWVDGRYWEPNVPVNVSIDDPSTPTNPDFVGTAVPGTVEWNPDSTYFFLSLDGAFEMKAGFLVTVSQGWVTKRHLVTDVTVTNLDPEEDIVSGTASTDIPVRVDIFCPQYVAIDAEPDSFSHWSADFTGLCDLQPGSQGGILQFDSDADSTGDYWRIPNPRFDVQVSWDHITGWDWWPNAPIQVSIDNPATGPGADFSVTVNSDQQGYFTHNELWRYIHLQPGFIVTVDDGHFTKEHTIINLLVNSADAATDIVQGTTTPGSVVNIATCWDTGCATRHETADGAGNWTANFALPGAEPEEQTTFDLQPETEGGANQTDGDGDSTQIYWRVPKPIIWGVTASNNWINIVEWPANASVQISIDDPSTPQNPDYATVRTTDGNGNFNFQAQYNIQVGSVVSVTDGSTTKQVTVSNFEVTAIDTTADTISGIGTPNANGAVWGPGWWEPFTIDLSGHWQIDLAGRSDIKPDDQGFAIEQDSEGDGTQFNWRLPTFMAQIVENQVRSYGWRLGASVTLSIDDPYVPGSPDYTETKIVTPANWDSSQTDILFELGEAITLAPGMTVTLTDGLMTKTHTITNLIVSDIDLDADTVSGTAQPGAHVTVGYICEQNTCAWRRVTADGLGNWLSDFSIPGEDASEQVLFDIKPGTSSGAGEIDEDGDETSVLWRVPYIQASINRPGHGVDGYNWPLGNSITLTVDNPGNGMGTDYEDVQTPEPDEWNPAGTHVEFQLGDFRLETSATVVLADGTTTMEITVAYLDITAIDTATDRVFGKADPGSSVQVEAPHHARRTVVADQSGNWMVDFSTPGPGNNEQQLDDIQPGRWITTRQYSDGGNLTMLQWQVPDYRVVAYPDEDVIAATDFWPGTNVTITVDDPENGGGVDLTRTGVVDTETGGWNCQTWWGFCFVLDLWGEFDVQPGQLITITDGTHTVSHVVTTLSITNVDFAASTVSGIAEPLGEINLELWPSCGQRHLFADEDGNWLEDFSVPGDEDFEQETCDFSVDELRDITAYEASGEGETWVGWFMPNPGFEVVLESNNINGWDWSMGATVTIEIDDPSTPANPDHTVNTVVGTAPWDPNRSFFEAVTNGYDLKPGDMVTVTDGARTKSTIIADIVVDSFDVTADTISGTTTPEAEVHVISDDGPERFTNADFSGNWSVDFSVEQDGNPVLDLIYGSAGVLSVVDEDGDRTYIGWEISFPQCQPGDTVTGTVFEHDGVTPVAFAKIQIDDYSSGEARFVTTTDSNGVYSCSLPDGDYRIVAFTDGNTYTQEYYDEATDVNATPIHVTGGAQFTNVNFTITPSPAIEHFTFNLDNPLLQDLSVRQAIALGTDRQRILNQAFLPNGIYGMVSNSIVAPEHWASASASELTLYAFDPVEARTILETAGWIDRDSDGFRENAEDIELSFVFKTNSASFRQASAEIFRQNMEAVGIRITIESSPIGEIISSRDFDIAEFAWAGCFDNEPCLGEYMSGSPYNYAHFINPAYDVAISNARSANSDAEKLPYLIEAQGILTNELPIFPLFTRYNVSPVTTPVGSNIIVSPESNLTIHFDEVTEEGVTTVLATGITPVNLPPNLELLGQVYDVGTSASFDSAQVCFTYDDSGLTPAQENAIRLFHLENGVWVDVTDTGYPDVNNNIVCGTVTSFSPFAVMYPLMAPYAPFVVFGYEGVWIKENSDILSGDVAANISASGPYLTDQSEVTIGQHVHFINSESRVLGDTVYLKQGSKVHDVYSNELKGQGTILGDHHTPLNLPLIPQFPEVPQVTPGTQNFNLPIKGTLTLNAGNYGKLEAKKGSIITFTGGVYHFSEWTLGDNVKVYFAAPTEIRIAGKLDIGTDAFVGPANGSNVTAHEIFIYVLGVNGNNSNIGATPKAAKFGMRNTIFANVYTPNGTLWIREHSTATGAFFGKWVMIGQNVTLTLDNDWR